MAEVGLVKFAGYALAIAKRVIPLYRNKYSKHTFYRFMRPSEFWQNSEVIFVLQSLIHPPLLSSPPHIHLIPTGAFRAVHGFVGAFEQGVQ